MYKAVKQICATCSHLDRQAYPGKAVCYMQNSTVRHKVRQAVLVKPCDKCNRWKGMQ